jgi:multidrug resistance efflux pump
MPMSRYILGTTIVSFLVLLGTLACLEPEPAVTETIDTRRGLAAGRAHIFAVGQVEGASEQVELRSRVPGQVVELLVAEGELVEQGQILLRLDDRPFRHRRDLAAAELDLAEAQLERLVNGATNEERDEARALLHAKLADLERARRDWERVTQLRHADAIAEQQADDRLGRVKALTAEVDAARARLEQLESAARQDEVRMAQARVDAARARLLNAETELEWTRLHAASSGQVLSIDVEPGELTGPDAEQAAVTVTDASRFRVRAMVEEIDAPRVCPGMLAAVRADGLPGQSLSARITRVSPRMSVKSIWSNRPQERRDTKVREVWLDLEQSADLVLGLRVDVFIESQTAPGDRAT